MKAVLIAALMFAVCLTFASPGLSADPDAHPERIVIIGDPIDNRTDIEHMVKGFERISAAKAFYESSGSEVWIEDPSYGIKDRVLGKLASDLKEAIGDVHSYTDTVPSSRRSYPAMTSPWTWDS